MKRYNHQAELARLVRAQERDDRRTKYGGKGSRWTPPVGTPRLVRRKGLSDPNWPAYVTEGPLTDNGLTIVILHSRADADMKGYAWVGKPDPTWGDT